MALCPFLPGPARSHVGLALGLIRTGCWGGLAAFVMNENLDSQSPRAVMGEKTVGDRQLD
jgi:hypothetical protein